MELSLPLRLPRRPRSSRQRRPGASRLDGVGGLALDALDALRARGPLPRAAICAAVVLPLLGGGWLWLRDSSLVGVRHVHIAGVHGARSIQIRNALDAAARRMSTLHASPAALRAAVASYPEVAGVSVTTGFPHTLSIHVRERRAVATLVGPGERTAIAADGTVLGPALVSGSLPTVAAKTAPAPGTHLREAAAANAAVALGAAPRRLLRYVERSYEGGEGLTLKMRNGLLVYFGDAGRPRAKWLSLARVLASPDAAGATYVDVRLPARPAAGFSQPSSTGAAATASTLTPAQVGTSGPAAAELAEQLSREVGGPSGSTTTEESASHEEEPVAEASQEPSPTG